MGSEGSFFTSLSSQELLYICLQPSEHPRFIIGDRQISCRLRTEMCYKTKRKYHRGHHTLKKLRERGSRLFKKTKKTGQSLHIMTTTK
ncbi:hypothetical protein YC2023_039859 [Brassica napus]